MSDDNWPEIPYAPWRETCAALHLYCQVLGKYRLAHAPWVNHSWHATLYPETRGLTTGPVPDGPGGITLGLDLIGHAAWGQAADGREARFALGPMSVAAFHARLLEMLRYLGGTARFHGIPNEVPDPVRFTEDTTPRPYDAAAVARFHRALLSVSHVFRQFRTGFLGKVSPVHLFWGSFDLAVTRFSGRAAPPHPGGVPGLPDPVTREAYSHQVSSAGFWPGGGGVEEPAFYSYAYPAPEGFAAAAVRPAAARFDTGLGEFLLPYEAVRQAADPAALLLEFLESSYGAAADLGRWDRAALDCAMGRPGRPRPV
ncbi:DUF5996 family protein [Pseudoroseomonas sp. WGS1072]|uniref:DUF5996 family protein n=1 Tax=Roseomonas sp. WGS1072 TaxID=3366816 RepID=UPI003BF2C786